MDLLSKSDEQLLKIANSIMDGQLDASMKREFKKVIDRFSHAVKKEFTEEMFLKQCDERESKFGHFTSRELMGIARQKNLVTFYWKQRVSKSDDEFLSVLALSQKNSEYIIERAYVDLWRLES